LAQLAHLLGPPSIDCPGMDATGDTPNPPTETPAQWDTPPNGRQKTSQTYRQARRAHLLACEKRGGTCNQ